MWLKIVGCLTFVILLNCNRYICGDVEHRVPVRNVQISKNITIHRNGYGRLLGLLSLLKGFRHRKHIYYPYAMSKLWRASFEFELKPQAISSSTYYPQQFGVSSGGVGSNTIDSIFHFGNNDQQSSTTVGGSNQIIKGPDERDEIPVVEHHVENHVVNKEAMNSVISVPPTAVEEKSERVLRHAIQPRTDEQSEEEKNGDESIQSTTASLEENDTTVDITTQSMTIPETTASTEKLTETATTTKPEYSSTASSKEPISPSPTPSKWLGYYDSGIHKPEFIQDIEFTTIYPSQYVSEDIRYVTYGTAFKPSLPDYNGAYSSNFFVPLRYYKRK